ncbi:hypothetical protein VP01_90g5 [Puccinia sorghi]|uniref:Uncharacterized protein n=1 Tax=Puccinia sorghi TaxID=27349 RepID=A0A0L6U9Q7_9BASI|nr:hypothetical protein VP01_90g5 [Puccinia sorghi]
MPVEFPEIPVELPAIPVELPAMPVELPTIPEPESHRIEARKSNSNHSSSSVVELNLIEQKMKIKWLTIFLKFMIHFWGNSFHQICNIKAHHQYLSKYTTVPTTPNIALALAAVRKPLPTLPDLQEVVCIEKPPPACQSFHSFFEQVEALPVKEFLGIHIQRGFSTSLAEGYSSQLGRLHPPGQRIYANSLMGSNTSLWKTLRICKGKISRILEIKMAGQRTSLKMNKNIINEEKLSKMSGKFHAICIFSFWVLFCFVLNGYQINSQILKISLQNTGKQTTLVKEAMNYFPLRDSCPSEGPLLLGLIPSQLEAFHGQYAYMLTFFWMMSFCTNIGIMSFDTKCRSSAKDNKNQGKKLEDEVKNYEKKTSAMWLNLISTYSIIFGPKIRQEFFYKGRLSIMCTETKNSM